LIPFIKTGTRHNTATVDVYHCSACTAYKIFTAVLLTRLKTYSASITGEYQAGFRKGRSTIEQLESFEMWCWRGMEFS